MGLSELLTKDTADAVAKHIVNSAVYIKDNDSVDFDCDFKINKGVLVSDEVNTWLKFDLKDTFYCEEIKKIQQELVASEVAEEYEAFDTWTRLVATLIENKHKDKLADRIRQHLLGGVPREGFPLNDIKVRFIEIDDVPAHDSRMRIDKMAPEGYISQPVSEEIFELMDETGKSAEEIIEEKKAEGNPNYKYITGVTFTKEFYEVSIDLWVDYSPDESTKPEELKASK